MSEAYTSLRLKGGLPRKPAGSRNRKDTEMRTSLVEIDGWFKIALVFVFIALIPMCIACGCGYGGAPQRGSCSCYLPEGDRGATCPPCR